MLKESQLSLLSSRITKLAMDFGTTRKTLQLLKELDIPVKRPMWFSGSAGAFLQDYKGPQTGLGVQKGAVLVRRSVPGAHSSPRMVLLHEAGHAIDRMGVRHHFKIQDLEQKLSKINDGMQFTRLKKTKDKLEIIGEARADGTAVHLIRKFSNNPREAERLYKVKREAGKNSYIAGVADIKEALRLVGPGRNADTSPTYFKILQRSINSPNATNTTKTNKKLYDSVLNHFAPPVPFVLEAKPKI
jgi:hypothetical protein